MTTKLWLSALCAVVLAGCAHHPYFRVPDPTRPQIVLAPSGQLVVNQEPIVIVLKESEPVVITWRLPTDSGLSFDPVRGIVIIGRTKNENYDPIPVDSKYNDAFTCGPSEQPAKGTRDAPKNPQMFSCELAPKGRIARGLYSYEINVIGPTGRIRLDPSIMPQ